IISNRQSKRKLRIFYSSLVILIFSLVASEINLPLGALVASIGVVICTWGYLIFLIPTKRKEPIIQAEAGQLIEKKRRFKSIDSIRGMGILLLVGFHIIIGLLKSPLEASEYFRDPFFAVFAIISTLASLFFIPAGASVLFSMNKRARKKVEPKKILIQQIKRGIFLILLGTVYDIFVYDFHWGIIDVLQITGLSIIIISLLYYPLIKNHYASSHEIKQKNMIDQSYKTLARTFSILALVVVLFSPIARMLFGYPVEDPNIDFFVSYSTPTNFIEYIQAWLTTSFYPIFPCLGFFFLGSAVGAIFLINRDKNQIIRKSFAKLIVILAILFQIAAVIISSIGGSLAGDLLLLPYNDQPKWVMEFTINAQPISTVLFLLHLGITFLFIGILYYAQDIEHLGKTQALLNMFTQKLRLQYLGRILIRFSYASLTIYILQYLWVVILRFYELATGIQVLYTIESLLAIVIWMIIATLFFVILSYYFEKYDYNYGFEGLDRKIQLWSKKVGQ
ncbi:MAG: heparan-alpha-glucosaminide N-acetyltransferase domain-containing protein, partial [Promethearchaeota archaeon]